MTSSPPVSALLPGPCGDLSWPRGSPCRPSPPRPGRPLVKALLTSGIESAKAPGARTGSAMRPGRKSGVGRPHLREVVPIGSPCEQRRTCWGSERLHFAPGPQPFLTGRATPVPHRRVDPGTQRTTTVTSTPPTSWSSSPDQQERIPRMCLIRMCSSRRLVGCLEDVPRDNDGHQRSIPISGMTSANGVTSIA
jgi:hypothetical protein